jgi:hypothetical protein
MADNVQNCDSYIGGLLISHNVVCKVVTNAALCPMIRSEASWDSVAVEIFDFNVNMLALTTESICPVKKCKIVK